MLTDTPNSLRKQAGAFLLHTDSLSPDNLVSLLLLPMASSLDWVREQEDWMALVVKWEVPSNRFRDIPSLSYSSEYLLGLGEYTSIQPVAANVFFSILSGCLDVIPWTLLILR